MWTRIVLFLIALIAFSFALQWLLPKSQRGRRITMRQYLMFDIAPLLVFFGILMTGLAMLEAMRQGVMSNWIWGNLLGIVGGVAISIALMQSFHTPSQSVFSRRDPLPTGRFLTIRIAFAIVKRYGLLLLLAIVGLDLAVRWLGVALEVLLTGGLGTLLLVLAIAVFVRARRQNPES